MTLLTIMWHVNCILQFSRQYHQIYPWEINSCYDDQKLLSMTPKHIGMATQTLLKTSTLLLIILLNKILICQLSWQIDII